ncbi:MAG: pyridoxamine 5'-phosphate oxidase family protein [Pseudomonadaceae bacterium]|nr:pyridoxamine 5'-phosphate oxidase family protein [Pseudomonadaceae bacterium]
MIEYEASKVISTPEALRALYGEASARALVKELDHISPHYQQFIEASPFVVIGSVGPEGLDTSPRGDPPGFVHVADNKTLLLPDRRGNNRADTLMNIVRDPRVSLLFLIPGVGETLRVIGKAEVVVDEQLCLQFEMQGKLPRSVMVLSVDKVYFQCQKALTRSQLWQAEAKVDRATLPTTGQMISALDESFDGESYDRNYSEYQKETIY